MNLRKDKYNPSKFKNVTISGKGVDVNVDMKLDFNNKDIKIGSSITGKVTDINNNPIEGALVKLMDSNLQPLTNTISDRNGNYLISSIPFSNNYNIIVISQGKLLEQSYDFMLNSNENKNLNFTLKTDANGNFGAISGVIKDINSKVIFGAIVLLYNSINNLDTLVAITYTDMSGIFMFNELNEGSYKIKITALGYTDEYINIMIESKKITNVSKILNLNPEAPEGVISGIIEDTSKSLVADANVILYKLDINNEIKPVAFTKTNLNGVYTFINVEPGDYFIKCNEWQAITVQVINEQFIYSSDSSLFAYINEPILSYNINEIF